MVWLLLLILLLAPHARAENYRCIDRQGNLVFTDDPASAPPGCRELTSTPVHEVPVVPAPQPPDVSGQAQDLIKQREARRELQAALFEKWQKTAKQIAQDYLQAQRLRYHPPRRTQANKEAGLQQMELAMRRKQTLMRELTQADAPPEQRRTIEKIVADVPDPPAASSGSSQ